MTQGITRCACGCDHQPGREYKPKDGANQRRRHDDSPRIGIQLCCADQGDPDLSREYAAALEVAREMVRGLEGLFTRPLTGAWYEWEDEEGNPCSMIAHADLPYRPNNFGCPPSYAKRIRRADPDEVAAVWREIDQHDEITRLSYGGPK